MPLVRLELRNEYSLGNPGLYREANVEDPKGILEGVAVAGLVGVLRQLGDLAEFAGEVFHGLQEQVATTTSRSHGLISRIKRLESALPNFEKAVLTQRSHLHFAYTAGCNWRTHIQFEKNQFVCSDVPKSIMEAYEDCRGPPRLQLLDKFDPGGPGSCLKRYSDPTLFKRVSATSGEASAAKILKHISGRKTKRRRPWPRSGEVSKNASFSSNNDRMQFPQVNIGRRAPLFPKAASFDASLSSIDVRQSKLGLHDVSGSARGMLFPDHSEQSEGQDFREHLSSPVKRSDSDFLDFNLVEEEINGWGRNMTKNASPQRIGCSSTSVGSNGKTELLEPRMQQSGEDCMTLEHDHNRELKSFSQNMDAENPDDYILDLQTLQKKGPLPLDERGNLQKDDTDHVHPLKEAEQSLGHADGNESEADNFLDALNTIETESEHELEGEKRKKAEPRLEEKGVDEVHDLECRSSASESSISLQISGVNHKDDVISQSLSAPDKAICSTDVVAPMDGDNSVCFVEETRRNTLENEANTTKSDPCPETFSGQADSSGLLLTHGRSSLESQDCTAETLTGSSTTFWTNGSLLGLQPSKPPDFKLSDSQSPNPGCQKDEVPSSSSHLSDKDAVNPNQDKFRNVEAGADIDGSRWKTAFKISPADLDVKLGKRLLSFGSTKKLFPVEKENGPADSQNPSCFEHKNHQDVAHGAFSGKNKDLFGHDSLRVSPSASPPLQHMKISFQPIEGVEISRLKLKFPHGDTDGKSGCDYFPSFQLVPEVLNKQDNVASDSDAESFDGSSSSASDDCRSNPNDFHSEWESNESPTSKEREIYDAFQRISVADSVSTAPGHGRIDHQEKHGLQMHLAECFRNPESCGSSVQNMDSNSFQKELRSGTITRPQLGGCFEDKRRPILEGSHSISTVSQPKPTILNESPPANINTLKFKRSSSDNSGMGRGAFREKSIDENDFLHQIRTKSFTLRRTATPKPTDESGSLSNTHVNALLKKAHAIREAVGSDGDDDGNWSET